VASDPRQPVRVLHVVRPAAGGMRGHVLQLATGLRRFGFESEIACPGGADLVHDALEANLLVHPVPIAGPLHPLKDPLAVIALAEVIRERRPGILHAHGSKAGLIARLAGRLAGRPRCVVTVHNDVLEGDVTSLVRRADIAVERLLSRRTARIITVSEALRREQLDVYGLPAALVTTVRNGRDLEPFLGSRDRDRVRAELGVPADALLFGQAARFAPQKALEVLIDASVPLLERDSRAYLVLAGDGPLLEVMRTKARSTPVRDRILFPGFQTDVPGFLAALDIYVLSSTTEGLSLALVEAMAAGLPVVATAVGGNPEAVEDGVTGLLVAPGRTAALEQAVARLLKDPGLRRSMGEAGRQRALAEFTEDRMLERTAAVYREVSA